MQYSAVRFIKLQSNTPLNVDTQVLIALHYFKQWNDSLIQALENNYCGGSKVKNKRITLWQIAEIKTKYNEKTIYVTSWCI